MPRCYELEIQGDDVGSMTGAWVLRVVEMAIDGEMGRRLGLRVGEERPSPILARVALSRLSALLSCGL